ncbi:AAA family ATPase [Candidatus Poribacteria bacterium]|nr:AAA family ATPase [Candidatus Poribacteria bacterium]
MPVNPTPYIANQIRNNATRETLKSGREDGQWWDLSNRPASDRLKQGTIGAQMGASASRGRAGTPIDNTQIPDYAEEDGTFFEDYDPRVFEKEQFEGAEKFEPTGQASPFEFTEAQKAAIQHGTGRGLVIAGPGSGKTAVTRERIFNLVQNQGVDPQRILSLTFNRAAADELFARAKDIGDVQVRTIHSFAKQIVEDNLEALGYKYKPKLVDEEDHFEPFVRRLLAEESGSKFVNERQVREIVSAVDVAKATVTEGLFDPSQLEGEIGRFATAYETFKTTRRKVEYQDLLIQAANLFEKHPEIRSRYQGMFDHVQIDEFQDVSQSDWRLLKQLGENLMAFGDDDQTIYSFRSGAGSVMQEFAETATQYPVTENFRSTPEIVKLGRGLIEGTRATRLPKDLKSTRESGVKPRYTETTPDTLIDALREELIPGKENVILVRTRAERGLLWNQLPDDLREHVSKVRTMHSVKGLEFERVIVLLNTLERGGGIYRSFPSVQDFNDLDALEEERRLLYVAITRAKDDAVLLGREQAFLPELGLKPPEPDVPDVEEPAQQLVEESKGIRKKFSEAFHRFRAHYQRVRAYQDMVAMERDLPGVEVIENLTDAQVHREKIEELGKQLGLEPTRRDQRARGLRFRDRLLTLPARPGLVAGAGYAGVAPTSHLGLIGGLDPVTQTLFNISPLGLVKGLRHLDESLYPHARRPYQHFDTYRPLHRELPDSVRARLPEGVDPADFRVVDVNLDDYRTTLYEFPHATEGWEGAYAQRPLFHERGYQMERITKAQADELAREGLYGEQHTYVDTSQSSRNVRVTPYDPFGGDPYFRPERPREVSELSRAAIQHLEQVRDYLETSRTSARRPKGLSPRMLDFRQAWGWQHKRLIRPIDRFLKENRGRDTVDFRGLSSVLNKLNRAHSRVSLGSPFGSHDLGGRNVQLHNEVLDLLEDVWNPDSPYYNPAHWTVARGRLHDLPDGLGQASGDPDNVQRGVTSVPRFGPLRPQFGRFGGGFTGRGRAARGLADSSAFIQLTNEAGKVQDIASGVFLGDGYVATVLHSLTKSLDAGLDLSGGTVKSLGGAGTFEIEGLRAWDPETELAILKVAGDTRGLGVEFGQLGRAGQRLRTMGIANRQGELQGLGAGGGFLVDEPYSSRVTLTGAGDDVLTLQGRDLRPGQSGSPIFDALGRLVGIFAGGQQAVEGGTGFGTSAERLQPLLAAARALDELGAPVHSLDNLAELGLPTTEEIEMGYYERGRPFGLGNIPLESTLGMQLDLSGSKVQLKPAGSRLLVGEDELFRLFNNERTRRLAPVPEPIPTVSTPVPPSDTPITERVWLGRSGGDLGFLTRGGTERLAFPLGDLTRQRRQEIEKGIRNRRSRIARARRRAETQPIEQPVRESRSRRRRRSRRRTTAIPIRQEAVTPGIPIPEETLSEDLVRRMPGREPGIIVGGEPQGLVPELLSEDVLPAEKGYYVKDGVVYELPEPEGVLNRPSVQPGITSPGVQRDLAVISAQLESPTDAGLVNRGTQAGITPEGAPQPVFTKEGILVSPEHLKLFSGRGEAQPSQPLPSGSTASLPILPPQRVQSSLDQQLRLDLRGGRDLRSRTAMDRFFGFMELLDTQGEGTALGYRLQTNIDGSQRLVRDFDIAPRWFGAETPTPIPDTATQLLFELTQSGELTTGVERPTYTRAYELGADVRNLIETGNFRQRTFGRAVAGGLSAADKVGSRLSGAGRFASRVWRSPVGRIGRAGFKKALIPLELLDLKEKRDYWLGDTFRRIHETQLEVGKHAAETRQGFREQFADKPELLALIESGEIPDWVSPEDRPYIEDAQSAYMASAENIAQAHAGLMKRRDDLLAERAYWRETQVQGGPLRGLGFWDRSPLEREAMPFWEGGKGFWGNLGQAALFPLSILDVAEKGPVSRGIRALTDADSVSGIQNIEKQIAEVEQTLALPGLADIGMTEAQRERRIQVLQDSIAQGEAAREAILQRTSRVPMPLAAGLGHASYAGMDRMAESRVKETQLTEQIAAQRAIYEGLKTQYEDPEHQRLSQEYRDIVKVEDRDWDRYYEIVDELDLGLRFRMDRAGESLRGLQDKYANLPTVQLRKIDSEVRADHQELHNIRLQRTLEQRLQGEAPGVQTTPLGTTGAATTPITAGQPQTELVDGVMDQVLGANVERFEDVWLPISPIDTSMGAFRTLEAQDKWLAERQLDRVPDTVSGTAPSISRGTGKLPFRVIARTLGAGDIDRLRKGEGKGHDYIVIKSLEDIYDGDTLKGMLYAEGLGIRGEEGRVRFQSIDTAEIQPEKAAKYRYHEEYRKPSMIELEKKLAEQARDILREKIKADPLNVGRTEDFIVRLSELSGKKDIYERYLGDVEFTDYDYYEDMLSQGLARVWGSRAKFGDPTTTIYDKRYTESQKDRAKTAFRAAERDMLSAEREQLKARILAPVGEFKQRFAGMADSYSIEGLVGTEGDSGFVAEIQASIQNSQLSLERYQMEIAAIGKSLRDARQRMLESGEEEPSVEEAHTIRRLEAQLKAAEDGAKATEQAIKGYQQVLTQSLKLKEGLFKELHKAEVEMIKASEAEAVRHAQEIQIELANSLKKQSEARKMLTERLAGDPDYVKSVEAANIAQLQETGAGAKTEYEKYSEQYDTQRGVVDTAFERMTAAGEKFQADKSVESLTDYEAAKVEYDQATTKLAHLRQLKGIWEQQYTAAETGAKASQAAIDASAAYVHKQQLKERVEGAGEDSEYVRNFIAAMGVSQEGILDQGLTGAPMQDAYQRLENFEQWFDTFEDRFDFVQNRLEQNITDETARVSELELGLEPQYAERERLEAAIKGTTDADEREALLKELGVVEDGIARDEASLKVSEGILETYLKDAERFDKLLEQVEQQLDTLKERVDKKEEDILTRSEANEQKYFDKFTGRQQSLIDKGKYDPGYDMFVRSIPKDERTAEQQAYIDREDRGYETELAEYVGKEADKDRKAKEREDERRKRYSERQQLRMHERMLSRVFTPMVELPGNYYTAWRKQGDIEERGDEQISDINERLAQDIQDVRDNNMLSIRQQTQQIEELEERAAKRRVEIEEDVAEKKKEIWDGVLESFGDTLAEMAIKEAEMAASSWLIGQGLGLLGWEKDGYGGHTRKGDDSSGGGVGDWLSVAKDLLSGDDNEQGNSDQGGQSSGTDIGDWLSTGLGLGSAAKQAGKAKDWVSGLWKGGEAATTAATTAESTTSPLQWLLDAFEGSEAAASATGGGTTAATTGGGTAATTTTPTFGPAKSALTAGEGGTTTFADSFLGKSLSGAGAAITGSYIFGELARDRGSLEEQSGKNTNPFLNVVSDASGQAWEGVKGIPGFVAELGEGAWDFVGDIGGFIADIPGTLNRTSGTGNWFTQTAKDIGGFFSDTFGKDSWQGVGDAWNSLTSVFGFDNTWNDEMAYRAGMRQAEHLDLSSPIVQMGHQSAMDLLELHTTGVEDKAKEIMRDKGRMNDDISYRAAARELQQQQLSDAADQRESAPAMNLLTQQHSDFDEEVQNMIQHATARAASGGSEYAEIVVNVIVEENGRQRQKQQERQVVKLVKQGVIERVGVCKRF